VAAEAVPHEAGHQTNTFASGSPITDGRRLWVSFGSQGIYCYDLEGKLRWKRDLGDMQTRNAFGEGASPALYKDTLIVPWDHEAQSFIAALDANTGEPRWKTDRDELTTWATPLIVEHDGRVQVIANGSNRVRSYDLKTGEVIWECGGQASNPIPSPVVQNDLVYCMTGYRGYAVYAIPLDSKGDITDSNHIAWSRTDAGPYVSSPLLYGGQLYFTKARDAVLSSLDAATGEPIIEQVRLPGLNSMYASPVAAADRIYFTSREGATIVLKHGPQLDVLATNRLDEGIDASPAIVGKRMYLRGENHLYCIE
jgi:outer membrane protein assembly factor BamB